MRNRYDQIATIVFDLDGTLYQNDGVADAVITTAENLVAASRGVSREQARNFIAAARTRLTELLEEEPPLTRICHELGIEIPRLHQAFTDQVCPERYLEDDPILQALLDSLRSHCDLYIYTNNNLYLAQKILALLGVEDFFERLYTIEFTWRPKPDRESLERVLEDIGGPAESFLFVGDRPVIDLLPAENLGIATLQVHEVADLLQIHKLLGIVP